MKLIRWFHFGSCVQKSRAIDLGINFKYPLQQENRNCDDRPMEERRRLQMIDDDDRAYKKSSATHNSVAIPKQHLKTATKVRCRAIKLTSSEVLFGISSVSLALEANRRTIHRLFLKPSVQRKKKMQSTVGSDTPMVGTCRSNTANPRLDDIEGLATAMGVPVQRVSVGELDRLSEDRPHQGVCLNVDRLQYRDLAEQVDEGHRLWIFVDHIHDPMNLGAIIRSAYYFGVDRIIASKYNTCPLTPVVSKASSGAMEIADICRTMDSVALLEAKASDGWTIVGTASEDSFDRPEIKDSKLRLVGDYCWPQKTILIIGNEGKGLSSEHLRLCQTVLSIPAGHHLHPKMRSLNVGVATGIILQNYLLQMGTKYDKRIDR